MPRNPAPRYEPVEPEDLPGAWRVYLAGSDPTTRDASRRPDPDAPDLPPRLYPHLLATSEGAFWVARRGAEVVGFAAAVPRGTTWFLSELWVHPFHRGQGIGTRLYRMVRRSTRGLRGRVRAALAGDDGGGLAIGLRDGLLARFPIFRVSGDAEAAKRLWAAARKQAGSLRVVRFHKGAGVGNDSPLIKADLGPRGASRPQDHAFWLAEPTRTAYLVWSGKRPTGYFYANSLGEVGPVAAGGAAALAAIVPHAVREAAKSGERVVLRVPAIARSVLEPLLDAGFRMTGGNVLLSTGDFCRLDSYLPGDDSLF